MKTHLIWVVAAAAVASGAPARSQTQEWIRQFGTVSSDFALGIAANSSGHIYVSGWNRGPLGGANQPSHGFLQQYDFAGELAWTRYLDSSPDSSYGYSVETDGAGGVYFSGSTTGDLGGQNAGLQDTFVSRFDAQGNVTWIQQQGTSANEWLRRTSVDGRGNLYVAGMATPDTLALRGELVLGKYDQHGTPLWTRQFEDVITSDVGIAADALGNVFAAGYVSGQLGSFVARYDADGELAWKQQVDYANFLDLSADNLGNVYVVGGGSDAQGTQVGNGDVVINKYDASGSLLWSRSLGTPEGDSAAAVFADAFGNVYVTGDTNSNLGGPHFGEWDVFLASFDSTGTHRWTRQFGTGRFEYPRDITSDGLGNVYITGHTQGGLAGRNVGLNDLFVAKYSIDDFSPPGDTNGDGVVDLEDLNNVRNHFGSTGLGDTNGDGAVDLVDLNNVRNNFGTGSSHPVPEPGAFSLATIIAAASIFRLVRSRYGAPRSLKC